MVGSYLDQVELVRVLGEGSSAVVYEGIDHASGQRVAVKVLKNARQTAAVDRDRFLDELRVSHSLSHPHLVTARDGGIARGHPYLVMRLASRGSLQDVLDRGRLSDRQTLEAIAQIGSALDAIHQQGLVHRDVKPGNVLVDETAGGTEYLLTDMGIIQPLSPNVNMHPGTIGYSAPEQMLGRLVDRRADVFSLGCLAYACLTGAPPWRRATAEGARTAVLEEPAPSIQALRPELPDAVQAVFQRALSKSPVDRHRTTKAFTQALGKALVDPVGNRPHEDDPPSSVELRRSGGWLFGASILGAVGLLACAVGLVQLEPLPLVLGLLGLSGAAYLLFRPRYVAQLDLPQSPRDLLESVAIDLRRARGWTSKPSRPGQVIVESEPGTPSLAPLLLLALLGILPSVAALLAMRRRSRIRVEENTTDGINAKDVPSVLIGIGTTGLQARAPAEALLTKLTHMGRPNP